MDMVIPNEGKLKTIYWTFGTAGGDLEDFVVDLYQNNYTPVDGSTASNFTISTFTGYAQVAVSRASFGSPVISSNIAVITSSVSPAFTCTGGSAQNAYGWLMRGATSGKVIAAALFDNVRNMSPGATETLTPFQMQLKTFA